MPLAGVRADAAAARPLLPDPRGPGHAARQGRCRIRPQVRRPARILAAPRGGKSRVVSRSAAAARRNLAGDI